VAEETVEAGGRAAVWLARPSAAAQEHALAAAMAAARAGEYLELAAAIDALEGESVEAGRRGLQRLRRQWREITRRDFFPPPERERAALALRELADVVGTDTPVGPDGAGAESARSTR
jgi:hypothetical protein